MLKRPDLWEQLEEVCSRIKFGELECVLSIQEGLPSTLRIKERVTILKDRGKEKDEEII